MGPLEKLRVVEFAGLGPAPLAGQLLADLGAQVTVIDKASAPQDPCDINRRGKQSIALNLKAAEGRRVALALLEQADILIEGFRPGVMERLGLGPTDCPPHLIYGRITGWGQTGPRAHTAGHDITYLATTGVLGLIGPAGAPPTPPLNLVADYGGGTMMLLLGVLSATIARGVSGRGEGRGQVVDAAMVDGVPALMGLVQGLMARGDWAGPAGTNWLDGGAPFYRCYACADGRYVAVGALEPQFYARLLAGLGLADATLPEQNNRGGWPALTARFAAAFAARDQAHWAQVFDGTDACVAPVLTPQEAAEDPHMAARGTFREVAGVRQAAPAPRFSHVDTRAPAPPGAPGGDTDAVLAGIGLDAAAIAALRAAGALT